MKEDGEPVAGGDEEALFRATLNNLAEKSDSQSIQGLIDDLDAEIAALEGSPEAAKEVTKLQARKAAAVDAQERAWRNRS